MKREKDKIKTRANIGATDPDWETIQQAAKIKGVPQSEYLRDTLVRDARRVVSKAGRCEG